MIQTGFTLLLSLLFMLCQFYISCVVYQLSSDCLHDYGYTSIYVYMLLWQSCIPVTTTKTENKQETVFFVQD